MSMTVIIVRNVAPRIHGYLSSLLLEVTPNVFVGPSVNPKVRGDLWRLLTEWQAALGGSIVMVWQDNAVAAGQQVAVLGDPPRKVINHEGALLVSRV